MVKKKSSKKQVSYNNKKIVLGIIVLVILFVLAFAYQDSRDDEEGLGNIFDRGNEEGDNKRGSKEIGDAKEKDLEEDEEKKSYVCCYIQCHNKKMPPYDFKVFNLEKEKCNKRSIEQSNNPDIVSFLDSCRTIKKNGKKKKLRRKDWDVYPNGEIDEGGICEDKKVANQCKGREIIKTGSPSTTTESRKKKMNKPDQEARYQKKNDECKKSDVGKYEDARAAFDYALKYDCWENAKEESILECKEGCTNIFSLKHLDWKVIESQFNTWEGKFSRCWVVASKAGKECCIWINECLFINECIGENREPPPDTPEVNPEGNPEGNPEDTPKI